MQLSATQLPAIQLPVWKRAVVKVGSNLIAPEGLRLSTQYLLAIAQFVANARAQGREIVLVSSGAVAAGRAALGGDVARTMSAKQALAAIGQPRLLSLWAQLFDVPCAQVLLAHDDLNNRRRFVNAKNTLRELLALRTLPIVNENDSVAVDELKVGDNDNLAAHVAVLVEADLLVILSDVDGLFDADPRSNPQAQRIGSVERIDAAIMALAGGSGSRVGTGGMRTKLEAAAKATARGITTVIVNGRRSEALDALRNDRVDGTLFARTATAVSAKAHWLRHALTAAGSVYVDAGAARALRERGASLLPPGVVEVGGAFRAGDAVDVILRDADGEHPLARGISQFDATELRLIQGAPSAEIEKRLGYAAAETVIHRDDLVLL